MPEDMIELLQGGSVLRVGVANGYVTLTATNFINGTIDGRWVYHVARKRGRGHASANRHTHVGNYSTIEAAWAALMDEARHIMEDAPHE